MLRGERFNFYSHLLGLVASSGASLALLAKAMQTSAPRAVAGVVVFGVTCILLYATSALFHGASGSFKRQMERLDHAAIFLFIAGSYTPFALLPSARTAHHLMLAILWVLAFLGVKRELSQHRLPAMWLYLAMGWFSMIGAASLAEDMGSTAAVWLLAGAVLYTSGTLFYRNPQNWLHAHGIWHLFVLSGTLAHFAAVFACMAHFKSTG